MLYLNIWRMTASISFLISRPANEEAVFGERFEFHRFPLFRSNTFCDGKFYFKCLWIFQSLLLSQGNVARAVKQVNSFVFESLWSLAQVLVGQQNYRALETRTFKPCGSLIPRVFSVFKMATRGDEYFIQGKRTESYASFPMRENHSGCMWKGEDKASQYFFPILWTKHGYI